MASFYRKSEVPDHLQPFFRPAELGLEASPDEYVAKLVEVFREVRRVLRRDGTCWLNLGDSYASNGVSGLNEGFNDRHGAFGHGGGITPANAGRSRAGKTVPSGLKPKDLVGIPWRVAFALQADGWWLRSDIVWSKPNPMPESVTDRPTKAHEYLFLLTKAATYYYDSDAVKEVTEPQMVKVPDGWATHDGGHGSFHRNGREKGQPNNAVVSSRNLRSVWTIATQPYPEAHFATFPEDLVIPCVKAGTSEHGVCPQCGSPWVRVVERELTNTEGWAKATKDHHSVHGLDAIARNGQGRAGDSMARTLGWQPTCAHNRQPIPAIVLDPFAGSGTTLSVARRLGRRAVGIELQADYLPLIAKRIAAGALPLLELLQVEEVTR